MTNNITLELTKCERDAWKEIAESKMTAEEFERCCEAVQRLLNEFGANEFEKCCEEDAYECKNIEKLEEIANA